MRDSTTGVDSDRHTAGMEIGYYFSALTLACKGRQEKVTLKQKGTADSRPFVSCMSPQIRIAAAGLPARWCRLLPEAGRPEAERLEAGHREGRSGGHPFGAASPGIS
jgi:hypothetical protein